MPMLSERVAGGVCSVAGMSQARTSPTHTLCPATCSATLPPSHPPNRPPTPPPSPPSLPSLCTGHGPAGPERAGSRVPSGPAHERGGGGGRARQRRGQQRLGPGGAALVVGAQQPLHRAHRHCRPAERVQGRPAVSVTHTECYKQAAVQALIRRQWAFRQPPAPPLWWCVAGSGGGGLQPPLTPSPFCAAFGSLPSILLLNAAAAGSGRHRLGTVTCTPVNCLQDTGELQPRRSCGAGCRSNMSPRGHSPSCRCGATQSNRW